MAQGPDAESKSGVHSTASASLNANGKIDQLDQSFRNYISLSSIKETYLHLAYCHCMVVGEAISVFSVLMRLSPWKDSTEDASAKIKETIIIII